MVTGQLNEDNVLRALPDLFTRNGQTLELLPCGFLTSELAIGFSPDAIAFWRGGAPDAPSLLVPVEIKTKTTNEGLHAWRTKFKATEPVQAGLRIKQTTFNSPAFLELTEPLWRGQLLHQAAVMQSETVILVVASASEVLGVLVVGGVVADLRNEYLNVVRPIAQHFMAPAFAEVIIVPEHVDPAHAAIYRSHAEYVAPFLREAANGPAKPDIVRARAGICVLYCLLKGK